MDYAPQFPRATFSFIDTLINVKKNTAVIDSVTLGNITFAELLSINCVAFDKCDCTTFKLQPSKIFTIMWK